MIPRGGNRTGAFRAVVGIFHILLEDVFEGLSCLRGFAYGPSCLQGSSGEDLAIGIKVLLIP